MGSFTQDTQLGHQHHWDFANVDIRDLSFLSFRDIQILPRMQNHFNVDVDKQIAVVRQVP